MPLSQLGPRCAVAFLLVGLVGCPEHVKIGEDSGTPDAGDPAASGATEETEETVDPLAEALFCPGLAEPMAIEDEQQLRTALSPTFDVAMQALIDDNALYVASYLAKEEGLDCVEYTEDEATGTTTASGSCVDVDGLEFQGSITSTSTGDAFESSWEDLIVTGDKLRLEGDGGFYADISETSLTFSIHRSWTIQTGDEDINGSYTLEAEGTFGLPGETYAGYLITADSEVPDGEMCFAMTCDGSAYRETGARRADEGSSDPASECRYLVQADRLWEIVYSFDSDGGLCETVTADGELFETDCD